MGLLDESFFVSDKPVEKEVEMPDGTKHILYFKQLPATEFQKYHYAARSEDEDVRAGSMAKLIAAGLCEPDGKPALKYERALRLNAQATNAIFVALLSVNGAATKTAEGKTEDDELGKD